MLRGVLEEWVQRQSLYMLAQKILQDYDRPGQGGQLVAATYREQLDSLAGISFDSEDENTISYIDGPRDYFKTIAKGRIPTGIGVIDRAIRGGLGPGEFGLIVSPPKRGKTAALINFVANAALAGHRVLDITLELHGIYRMERLDMRLAGATSTELAKDPKLVAKARSAVRRAGGSIIIRDLSHETVTVPMVEALIRKHKPVDLVCIDYPALMFTKAAERRFEIGDTTRDLRKLARRLAVPIWGAGQGNRTTIDAEEYGLSGIAEDISQTFTCDAAICLMQTPEEKMKGIMRMGLLATRGSSDNPTAYVRMDFDRMTMSPIREEDHATEAVEGPGYKSRSGHQGVARRSWQQRRGNGRGAE